MIRVVVFICFLSLSVFSPGLSAFPQESKINQKRIEKERIKKQKESEKKYAQAKKRHQKMQTKETRARMKQTRKESAGNTPLRP